ncbi:MAG TPA: serine/threonine-protein kinase [Kofleriaceae bacterium]|nr:serine/threonine-protein kinase [Kofleriaceae bacterium]
MSDPTSILNGLSVDPDLEPGQVVGEYKVESKIGQGGFGAVFKASHPLIGKVVAIKVLARRFSVDPEMVERFIAEARAVNQIRHGNIIDIFSFGQLADGRHYYVMEYLEGEPLDVLLQHRRVLPLPEALQILRPIARALDAAHGKGIAHRDLKPENIFVSHDAEGALYPKLLDFGIAKLLGSPPTDTGKKIKTRTGIPIGTPYYMSPEQCRGKDVDHRTDYYAFGVLAYQMLTGVCPFDGDDYMAIMMQQLNVDPPPPSAKNAELSPLVDRAVMWLMAKDREQRPPDLMTAVRALDGRATSAPMVVVTPRVTGAGEEPVVRPRGKLGLVGAGLAATAIAGIAAFALLQARAHHDEPTLAPPPAALAPPPAAPAAPPPAAVVTAPADASATITLAIDGVPAGTEVVLGDRVIGAAPGEVRLARGAAVVLVLRHAGFAALQQGVTPDRDQTLHLALKRVTASTTTSPTKHDSHDIEDPFHH